VVEAPRPTGTVPDGIARGRCNRAAVGAVLGGAVGGILGSRIGEGGGKAAATIAGTLLGMVIGGSIGRSMDEADRYCLGQTLEYARDRQPVRWSNPDSGVEYVATPTSSYREHSEYCRRFVTEVRRGDRTERIPETACRRSDGSWVTVAGR
jgi:surface antigen